MELDKVRWFQSLARGAKRAPCVQQRRRPSRQDHRFRTPAPPALGPRSSRSDTRTPSQLREVIRPALPRTFPHMSGARFATPTGRGSVLVAGTFPHSSSTRSSSRATARTVSSVQGLGNSLVMSMPRSAVAVTAIGSISRPGSEPPDQATALSPVNAWMTRQGRASRPSDPRRDPVAGGGAEPRTGSLGVNGGLCFNRG